MSAPFGNEGAAKQSDDTASFKARAPSLSFPATFWGAVVALISWPFIALAIALGLATSLAIVALVIIGLVVAALAFVVLGVPAACVAWLIGKILG